MGIAKKKEKLYKLSDLYWGNICKVSNVYYTGRGWNSVKHWNKQCLENGIFVQKPYYSSTYSQISTGEEFKNASDVCNNEIGVETIKLSDHFYQWLCSHDRKIDGQFLGEATVSKSDIEKFENAVNNKLVDKKQWKDVPVVKNLNKIYKVSDLYFGEIKQRFVWKDESESVCANSKGVEKGFFVKHKQKNKIFFKRVSTGTIFREANMFVCGGDVFVNVTPFPNTTKVKIKLKDIAALEKKINTKPQNRQIAKDNANEKAS